MSTLCAEAKSSQAPLGMVPLLGVAIDVSIRVRNSRDETQPTLGPEIKV
jgi:hypothetical protein